jgi:4-oxalomesaconate tautomerase
MLMRGGTSKGAYFLASDLPADDTERDALLLRIMGSPDARQTDGIGGGHPLASKVAVVSPSAHPGADVDYLFLQVAVDRAEVSASQNCGNILAGVGPFAVERGLLDAGPNRTDVRIHMLNTDSIAVAEFATDRGQVVYDGDTEIDGVPGTSAPIHIAFIATAGSTCGSLFPTGHLVDEVDGVRVTCIDNGMPVVLIAARDLGVVGTESPAELEANTALASKLSEIRAKAGKFMGFDDVSALTVPKMTLVSPPTAGGTLSTRTFIPVRCHTSIGVLGALSVGAAATIPGTLAHDTAPAGQAPVRIEHPTGFFDCDITTSIDAAGTIAIARSAVVRTARKLLDGTAFAGPMRPY